MKPAALSNGFGKAFLLVGALAGLLLITACSSDDGTTPTCSQDVTADGHQNTADGCNTFAVCEQSPNNPAACCKNANGEALTGFDLEQCLYGFGVDVGNGAGGGP